MPATTAPRPMPPVHYGRIARLGGFCFLAATLLLPACSHVPTRGTGETVSDSRVITAQEINQSGARTAWDALRSAAPVSIRETASGTPRSMRMRGHSSFHLDDTPVIILDGVRVNDLAMLRNIDAAAIAHIELVNGVQGTFRYGTGSGGGAIVITTRAR